MKRQISEAEAERLIDRRVTSRLATDMRYQYAEDAQSQAAREELITAEVVAEIEREYAIFDHETYWERARKGRNSSKPS